ncbi:MAG: hypothetical protein A2Z15_02610 [Chloroflexi bacterium RBG_16_50_11]|nr:MAG: hypothetical protein A2Z15_02610 [Chloroflexi bacterium RBG_16_50_11]
MRGKIDTPTSILPVTPKERRQIFAEKAKLEKTTSDIEYWGIDSFGGIYHSILGKIPCPSNISKQLKKQYKEQGIITPRRK